MASKKLAFFTTASLIALFFLLTAGTSASAATLRTTRAAQQNQVHALAHHAQAADSQTITVNVTSYGYNDNDDGNGHYGTAQIAYPIVHSQATEGSGTYDDPITFATDENEFAPGTYIYVPFLQKYFVMEDGCVECSSDWQNGIYHVDLWMGPASMQPEPALDDCEASITGSYDIIVNPDTNQPVDTTPLFSNGTCTAQLH